MIVWQSNGYGEIRITKALDEGIRIDSGYNVPGPEGKFYSRYSLEIPEEAGQWLRRVFSEGFSDCHTMSGFLPGTNNTLRFEAFGKDAGPYCGDWSICRGKERLISGSCNFKGLVEALTNPGDFVG